MSESIVRPAPGLVLPPRDVVAGVRRLIEREGLGRTQALLGGVGRDVVTRLRGGLPLRLGSLVVARAALAAIDPEVRP